MRPTVPLASHWISGTSGVAQALEVARSTRERPSVPLIGRGAPLRAHARAINSSGTLGRKT